MRLAGVDGSIVHKASELKDSLNNLINNEEIGVILLSSSLVKLCKNYILSIKLNMKKPLIVEIPDRYSSEASMMQSFSSMADYVHKATGMSIGF